MQMSFYTRLLVMCYYCVCLRRQSLVEAERTKDNLLFNRKWCIVIVLALTVKDHHNLTNIGGKGIGTFGKTAGGKLRRTPIGVFTSIGE